MANHPTLVKLSDLETALSRGSQGLLGKRFESMSPGDQTELASWTLKLPAKDLRRQWSIDDRDASLMQSFLTREGPRLGAEVRKSDLGYEVKFDNLDPGWIWSLHDWIKGLRKHGFVEAPDDAVPIGNNVRIAVTGDWGTGAYGAPVCADSIDRLDGLNLIVHLGDIYYAGDLDEVRDRFLKFWPKRTDAVHRALNGNHEMYTGGHGYFDLVLTDPRFQQQASYFAFVNDHVLLVGLDTAYEEHDLHGDQAGWLRRLLDKYPGRRAILFSHHQPFSAFEGQGIKLVHKLSDLLRSQRIAAWYWGHEHACVRYDVLPAWDLYGRCVGHGGFPYFRFVANTPGARWVACNGRNGVPNCVVLDGGNPFIPNTPNDYGPNGYLVLDLQGRSVTESYRAPDGTEDGRYVFDIKGPVL